MKQDDAGTNTNTDSGTPDSGTPPPLGNDEPSYDAGYALILRDSFDQYADRAAALQPYRIGRNHDFVELIAGRGGSGNAIRLKYGRDGGTDDILFGPETRLDQVGQWNGTLPERAGPYRHLFFTTWFRPSAGADPADVDTTGSGLKGFMFWRSDGGRYQNAVNRLAHPDGATRGPKGAIGDNATTGRNLYKTMDGRAPLWSRWADGNWHRFTTEIFAGSHPSGHFGQRFWLDGELVYSDVDADVSGMPIGHYDFAAPVAHWAVFGNFVSAQQASTFFTLDFDDWIAWTD